MPYSVINSTGICLSGSPLIYVFGTSTVKHFAEAVFFSSGAVNFNHVAVDREQTIRFKCDTKGCEHNLLQRASAVLSSF